MLKLLGIVLVVFSCTAMGWNQSIAVENRLRQLREIEKLVHLILGKLPTAKRLCRKCFCILPGKQHHPLTFF